MIHVVKKDIYLLHKATRRKSSFVKKASGRFCTSLCIALRMGHCFKKTIFLICLAGICVLSNTKVNAEIIKNISDTFSITTYGAVNSKETLSTDAVQKAIDAANAKGGGVVLVPAGTYLCGPIILYSNITLYIEKNAMLLLNNDIKNFPSQGKSYLNFISASKARNISIVGNGIINGNGEAWWKAYRGKELTLRRPQLIYFSNCQNILIKNIHTLNPPNTHFSMPDCENVVFDHVIVEAPATSPNTDGINLSGKNIKINYCKIKTGDDNIALNISRNPAGNITVTHCEFGWGHGLSIGSFTGGGLDGLLVDSCTFDGTTSGIRLKSNRGRGGVVKNLVYKNIQMDNVKYPIFISGYYPKEPATPDSDPAQPMTNTTPVWKDISLSNINVKNGGTALMFWGLAESPVENVQLENVRIQSKSGAKIYNAKNINFVNCSISTASGNQLDTYNASVNGNLK